MILRGDTDDRLFHNVAVSLIQPEEGPLRGTAAIDRSARIGTAFSQVRVRKIRQGKITFCGRCNTDTAQRGGNGHYCRQHKQQMPEGTSSPRAETPIPGRSGSPTRAMDPGIEDGLKELKLQTHACHKSQDVLTIHAFFNFICFR